MKRNFLLSVSAGMLALTFTACGLTQNSAPLADKMLGSNPGELEKQIEMLLKKAGADLETAEFAEIVTGYNANGYKPSLSLTLDIVNPANPDKLLRASWYDSESSRNHCTVEELMLTDSDDNVIAEHAAFEDMLFTYAEVKTYIDNAPVYCAESLEASGYGADGFAERLDIERNPHEGNRIKAMMRVGYKGQNTLHKSFTVAPDGQHIVKK